MIKIGSVLNDESMRDSKTKFFKKWFTLNFNFEECTKGFKDDRSDQPWTRFFMNQKIKLEIIDDSLFLNLNWSRQEFIPRIVSLFVELFRDFDELLEKHPSLTKLPVLEEKELTPEELGNFLSRFNDREIESSGTDVQHPDLLPELRPYQEDAVRWLLRRETSKEDFIEEPYETIHARHLSNEEFLLNLSTLDIYSGNPPKCFLPAGGILADEMGLGSYVFGSIFWNIISSELVVL